MEGGKWVLGRKGQGVWGPVPGCAAPGANRKSPSDPGRSLQGRQSRSKLSMVQIRCTVIDFSAHIAGWRLPREALFSVLGKKKSSLALCELLGEGS